MAFLRTFLADEEVINVVIELLPDAIIPYDSTIFSCLRLVVFNIGCGSNGCVPEITTCPVDWLSFSTIALLYPRKMAKDNIKHMMVRVDVKIEKFVAKFTWLSFLEDLKYFHAIKLVQNIYLFYANQTLSARVVLHEDKLAVIFSLRCFKVKGLLTYMA